LRVPRRRRHRGGYTDAKVPWPSAGADAVQLYEMAIAAVELAELQESVRAANRVIQRFLIVAGLSLQYMHS